MRPFGNDKLTRAFRDSLGLPEHENQDTPEDLMRFQRAIDNLGKKPFGSVSRKFYRKLRSIRPKLNDNYEWLDAPGAADTILPPDQKP